MSFVLCVEANRLPGLQSSKQNLEEENQVYDRMMRDVLRLLVLPPLTGCQPDQGLFQVSARTWSIRGPLSADVEFSFLSTTWVPELVKRA